MPMICMVKPRQFTMQDVNVDTKRDKNINISSLKCNFENLRHVF